MTEDQMKWAEEHDWFVGRAPGEGVMAREVKGDAKNTVEYPVFFDFEEMRAWAGY